MRDRASVNDVAMRTIKVVYNELLDVGCFSYTLNHVGERINTPILHDFCNVWIAWIGEPVITVMLVSGSSDCELTGEGISSLASIFGKKFNCKLHLTVHKIMNLSYG